MIVSLKKQKLRTRLDTKLFAVDKDYFAAYRRQEKHIKSKRRGTFLQKSAPLPKTVHWTVFEIHP